MTLDSLDTVIGFAVVMLMLSMLITIAVQMVSTVLGLRGRNLRWGVVQVLKQVDPDIGAKATHLAEAVLRHPAISHHNARATALRADELVLILKDLAQREPTRPEVEGNFLQRAFAKLARCAQAITQNFTQKPPDADAQSLARDLMQLSAPNPAAGAAVSGQATEVVGELVKLFPADVAAIRAAVARTMQRSGELQAVVERWFNVVMDRTTERFVMHTRITTAGCAVALAFFLHVDSLHILKQISANREMRASLVAKASDTLQQAERIVGDGKAAALASEAIQRLVNEHKFAKAVDSNLVTREQGARWVAANAPDPKQADDLVKKYHAQFDSVSVEHLKSLGMSLQSVNKELARSQVQLSPQPMPAYFRWTPWPEWEGEVGWDHFLGMLMSALFLSLGAPFWFNALRNVANLRPILAGKVEKMLPAAEEPRK